MQTQLQILTAVVKLFLKRPEKAQGLVQKVLQAATAENDNPDVRDRAYVYWRLLSNTSDPNATKNIVLSDKPPIVTTIQSLPPNLLDQLLGELSTLASVYHKPPEQFVGQGRFGADAVQRAAIEYVPSSLYNAGVSESALMNILGNKSKTLGRIRWQLRQQQLRLLAVLHLRSPRAMSRICWISTSMAPRRHPLRKNRVVGCQVSKVWPERPSGWNLRPQGHLLEATTWTTCSECLAMALQPLRPAGAALPMVVQQT